MSTRPAAASLLAALVVGALLGAATTYLYLRPAPAQPRSLGDSPASAREAPLPPPGSGIVSVTLSSGNTDIHGSGIAVAGDDIIIVPLGGFRPATRGSWRGADGRRRDLDRAVAWNFDLGIAIFAVGDAGRDGLDLSAEDGSLFLGLDLVIVTSDGFRDGFVDSSAIAMPTGGYQYNVSANTPGNLRGAALVAPQTRTLIGLALTSGTGPESRTDAIDAGALRDLIGMRSRAAPLSVAELSDAYLRSFPGLRATLQAELVAGRWEAAVTAAEGIAQMHGQRIDPDIVASALNAYVNGTEYYLEAGAFARALDIANRGELRFGPHALLRLNRARALAETGNIDEAIRTLQSFLSQDPATTADEAGLLLRDQLRALVVREVTGDALPAPLAVDLLERSLVTDDYAAYHRHLGEHLYEQGRYVEAETSLRRAVELDPSYAAELEYALAESRQRRSTARLIEVPLRSLGNAILVTVRLNRRPELYRFLLDTGATYSAINMRTLLRLGLNEVLANSGAPIQLETANGTVNAGSIRLDSIDLSGAVVEQVPVVVLEELGDIDGLLGLSFLSHFDIEINQRDNKLLLTPR